MVTHHRATERHLPYGSTQCYLPPDTGERPSPNSAKQTRFTYPGGMKGWVDLAYWSLFQPMGLLKNVVKIVSNVTFSMWSRNSLKRLTSTTARVSSESEPGAMSTLMICRGLWILAVVSRPRAPSNCAARQHIHGLLICTTATNILWAALKNLGFQRSPDHRVLGFSVKLGICKQVGLGFSWVLSYLEWSLLVMVHIK